MTSAYLWSHPSLKHNAVLVKIHIAVEVSDVADDLLFIDMQPELMRRYHLHLYGTGQTAFFPSAFFP